MAYYALLGFFIVEYIRPSAHFPPLELLLLNSLVPLAAILGTLALRTPISSQRFFADTNTKAIGVLLGLLLISLAFAPVTTYAYKIVNKVSGYMLIYMVMVRQLGDRQRIKGVFGALILVHIVVIALSPEMFSASGRPAVTSGAFLGDGNDFALSVCIVVPLSLFLLFESGVKLKLLLIPTVLVLVMSVVATQSRGGTLALIAVGLYYWIKSQRKVLTAAVFVVVVAIALVTAPPEYFERMRTMGDTEESSASSRIDAWKTAVKMAARSPLLGAGAGHFGQAFGQFNGGRWMTAHSIYFLLLGELGLPGIALLLFLIIYNLAANRRLQREIRRLQPDRAVHAANLLACTSASLVAFAVAGAFLSAAYYPHIYVIAGLLTAARHVVQAELADKKESVPAVAAATALAPLQNGAGISTAWRPRPAMHRTTPHRTSRGRARG